MWSNFLKENINVIALTLWGVLDYQMSLTSAQGPKEPDPPTQLEGLKADSKKGGSGRFLVKKFKIYGFQVRYWMKQNLTQQTPVTKPTDNIMLSEIYVDRACSFRLEIQPYLPCVIALSFFFFPPYFSLIRLVFSLPLASRNSLCLSLASLSISLSLQQHSLNAAIYLTLSSILSIDSFCHSLFHWQHIWPHLDRDPNDNGQQVMAFFHLDEDNLSSCLRLLWVFFFFFFFIWLKSIYIFNRHWTYVFTSDGRWEWRIERKFIYIWIVFGCWLWRSVIPNNLTQTRLAT